MADITSTRLLWFKAWLFLVLGVFAAVLLVLQEPTLTVVALLCITVWAFCRFYYFAFYVIQHYVDPNHRFAGLIAFLQYALRKKHDQ